VDGVDDFGGVDALQVDAGNAEVAVAELALDDVEWDAFAGHFNGVGVVFVHGRIVDASVCASRCDHEPANGGDGRRIALLIARRLGSWSSLARRR